MSRILARTVAFKIVYQNEFQKDNFELIHDSTIEEENISEKPVLEYIDKVTKGVFDNNEDIEKRIEKNLKQNWSIKRISKINIAILKVSTYELVYLKDEIPPKASIDEALKLVDEYGMPEDKSFVNGILANIYKEVYGG